jgi:8-oxo-dGTP diphosphatase
MVKTVHDSEVAADGQQVISVCGFIYDGDGDQIEVFLPKRAATKKFLPNAWEMPGGHVDYGEDIVEALKREVSEEFDQTIDVGDPFAVFTYINKIKGSHSIEVIYFAKFTNKTDVISFNTEDHSGYQWFNRKRVKEIAIPERANSKREISVSGTDGFDHEMDSVLKGFDILEGKELNTLAHGTINR